MLSRMDDLLGGLGLLCLLVVGAGWGVQLSRHGVTWAALAVTLLGGVTGLVLTTGAFLRGHDRVDRSPGGSHPDGPEQTGRPVNGERAI